MVVNWSTPLRDIRAPKVASAVSICGPNSVWVGGMTSPSRNTRPAGCAGAASRTNGLPRADGSSTLAMVLAGRLASARTLSSTEAPEAARFSLLTRPTTFWPSRTSAPMAMPSAVGRMTVTDMACPGALRPSGRSWMPMSDPAHRATPLSAAMPSIAAVVLAGLGRRLIWGAPDSAAG